MRPRLHMSGNTGRPEDKKNSVSRNFSQKSIDKVPMGSYYGNLRMELRKWLSDAHLLTKGL